MLSFPFPVAIYPGSDLQKNVDTDSVGVNPNRVPEQSWSFCDLVCPRVQEMIENTVSV